jgi:hypothetical protein
MTARVGLCVSLLAASSWWACALVTNDCAQFCRHQCGWGRPGCVEECLDKVCVEDDAPEAP